MHLASGAPSADKLPARCRGSAGVLREGFFRRAISRAQTYRRATGYFSSSVFAVARQEVGEFFSRGGVLEVVCSPVLSGSDVAAITSGLYQPERWFGVPLARVLSRTHYGWAADLLSWAIACGQMHLKVAVLSSPSSHAVYHEKFGLLIRADGSSDGFEGSANESENGYVSNYERLRILSSERPADRPELRLLLDEFDLLWSNQTPGLDVMGIHEALRQGLVHPRSADDMQPTEVPKDVLTVRAEPEILRWPSRLQLRPHQKQAVDAWFRANGRGIFEMATGTGKTITAFGALCRLRELTAGPLVVVIVAPFLTLVDQWRGVAREFGLDPVNCSGDSSAWQPLLHAGIFLINTAQRNVLSIVTTNATFAGERFQDALNRIEARTVVVADEVHNLGAVHLREALPDRVSLRLGLSATPKRWMDEEGTRAVEEYFGPAVLQFGLEDALRTDPPLLTPYTYYPVIVQLEEDEADEYLRLTRLLARYSRDPEAEALSPEALALLLKRARLIGSARRKIPALVDAIRPYRDSRFNLVYCGDGRSDMEISGRSQSIESEAPLIRQVDAVARVLGRELRMHVARFTAETESADRLRLLDDFERGQLQALVAIRCLDEGVDIPATRRAFILASSTNPRQFVQRRGRVLRRADGKDRAEIYDFLVAPPAGAFPEDSSEFDVIRNLLRRELGRVVEFARLALNGPQATLRVEPLLTQYRLLNLLALEGS